MASIATNARHIHYDDVGSGPPLVMLAGAGSPRSVWTETVEALSSSFRCLVPDNRDAGENDPESGPYSLADMADDVAAFLRVLGIERAHVMGHSMGGAIALLFALNHPDLLDHLVLIGTAGAVPEELPSPDPARWIDDPVERARQQLPWYVAPGFFEAHPGRLEQMAQHYQPNRLTFDGLIRQFDAIPTFGDLRSRLHEIDAPTLVIQGEADTVNPPSLSEELAAGIPQARLVVLPNVGHDPRHETPETFCHLVREFLT